MVLLTTFQSGEKTFVQLGDNFQIIDEETSSSQFQETAQICFGPENINTFLPHCYAFLVHHRGSKLEPIYVGQQNFILNDSGGVFKTFENYPERKPLPARKVPEAS